MKLLHVALAALLAFGTPVSAAGLYPLSRYQQVDANGKPLAGARLRLFNGGTTTPRVAYKDSSLTTPHPNPIIADSNGRLPLIYLADGFYRQRLETKTGAPVFDDDGIPVLSSTAGGSGTSVDPDATFKTRDMKIRFDNQPLAGYVRLNGLTIGSAASGATERANADTQSLYTELWSFSNIVVTGGKGVSAVADFAADKPLVLPDGAGRGLFGMDNMGAGAKNRLINTVPLATEPGAVGGLDRSSLGIANLPSATLFGSASGLVTVEGNTGPESVTHTHTGSGTTSAESRVHTHPYDTAPNKNGFAATNSSGITGLWYGSNNIQSGVENQDHTHDYSFTTSGQNVQHYHYVASTGTNTLSASVALPGSGTQFTTVSPLITVMFYVRL